MVVNVYQICRLERKQDSGGLDHERNQLIWGRFKGERELAGKSNVCFGRKGKHKEEIVYLFFSYFAGLCTNEASITASGLLRYHG